MKLVDRIALSTYPMPFVILIYFAYTNPELVVEWIRKSAPETATFLALYLATMILFLLLLVSSISRKKFNNFLLYLSERSLSSKYTIIPHYEPPAELHPAVAGFLIDRKIGKREFYATLFQLIIEGNLGIDERIVNGKYKYYLIKNQGFNSSFSFGRLVYENIFNQNGKNLDSFPFEKITPNPNFLFDFIRNEMIRLGYFENPYLPELSLEAASEKHEKARREWIKSIKHSWGVLGENWAQRAHREEKEIREVENFFQRPKIKMQRELKPGRRSDDMVYTKMGEEERAKWLGFKDYLQTAERFRLNEEKIETFSKYLPYAIALGVETQWAHRFENMSIDRLQWFQSQVPGEIKRHNKIYYKHLVSFLGQMKVE